MSNLNSQSDLPQVWNVRRGVVCTLLVLIGIAQTLATIALSKSSATLLNGENLVYGIPVLPALLTSALVALGFFVIQNRTAEQFALSYVHDVRMAYAEHALLLPFDGKSPGIGLSLTRLVNDLGAVKLWLSRGFLALVTLASTFATLGAWIILAESSFLAPLAASLTVWVFGVAAAMPFLRTSIRRSRQKRGGIAILLGRVLPERMPLLMHGKLPPILNKLSRKSKEVCNLLTARATWSGVIKAVSRATFPAAVGVYALTGGAEIGSVALFLLVFAFLSAQLEAGAAGLEYYEANRVAREKLANVFKLPALTPFEPPSGQKTDWHLPLTVTALGLPSGKTLSTNITPGECTWIRLADPRDLHHVALSLSGLTQSRSQDAIQLGGRSFAEIGRKTIWQRVALVSPVNGIPTYQKNVAAHMLGARKKAPSDQPSIFRDLLELEEEWFPEHVQKLPESERVRVRLGRAFLRKPKMIVVHDDALLSNADMTARLKKLASHHKTTLVLLTKPAALAAAAA